MHIQIILLETIFSVINPINWNIPRKKGVNWDSATWSNTKLTILKVLALISYLKSTQNYISDISVLLCSLYFFHILFQCNVYLERIDTAADTAAAALLLTCVVASTGTEVKGIWGHVKQLPNGFSNINFLWYKIQSKGRKQNWVWDNCR